jgi:hypothetical protein
MQVRKSGSERTAATAVAVRQLRMIAGLADRLLSLGTTPYRAKRVRRSW